MSQPAYTPGPWHLEWPDEDEQWSNYLDDPTTCDPTAHVSTSRWGNFASVVVLVHGEPDAEGKANARLIAAAPDGFDIAEWALEVCIALDATDLGHVTMNDRGEYLRDAILAFKARVEGNK